MGGNGGDGDMRRGENGGAIEKKGGSLSDSRVGLALSPGGWDRMRQDGMGEDDLQSNGVQTARDETPPLHTAF